MYNQSHFFLEKFSWQKFVGTCYRLITNEIKIKLNQFNRKKKKSSNIFISLYLDIYTLFQIELNLTNNILSPSHHYN